VLDIHIVKNVREQQFLAVTAYGVQPNDVVHVRVVVLRQ
jgi:hypothetical protein